VVERVFTFGPSSAKRHWPDYRTRYGAELAITVTAPTESHCIAEVLNRFGRDWAFSYKPTVARRLMPDLVYVPIADWPGPGYPAGRWAVRTEIYLESEKLEVV
jgi:hypothetical protein